MSGGHCTGVPDLQIDMNSLYKFFVSQMLGEMLIVDWWKRPGTRDIVTLLGTLSTIGTSQSSESQINLSDRKILPDFNRCPLEIKSDGNHIGTQLCPL